MHFGELCGRLCGTAEAHRHRPRASIKLIHYRRSAIILSRNRRPVTKARPLNAAAFTMRCRLIGLTAVATATLCVYSFLPVFFAPFLFPFYPLFSLTNPSCSLAEVVMNRTLVALMREHDFVISRQNKKRALSRIKKKKKEKQVAN